MSRTRTATIRPAPGQESGAGPRSGTAALIYFGLALLFFLPAFLPGRGIFGTDYLAGAYFFYDFFAHRFAAGELPKWVPSVYGGVPVFASPGSAFYPVWWLAALLLPVSRVLPAIFVFQVGVAGLGMHLLARELGARRWVALVSGLAFEFTGILLSAVYAGHDGRIIVASFAPLLFFFLHRAIRTGAFAPFVGVAATIGFFLLSFQIQSAYYLLLAAALWAGFLLLHFRRDLSGAALGRRIGLGLAAVGFGFALAAVNFLPFVDSISESPRGGAGGRGYEYSTSYSMPIAEIGSIAVPEQVGATIQDPETGAYPLGPYRGGNPLKLHTEYLGATVLALFALGFGFARRDRRWWFFGGLALLGLLISLGGNTPVYRLFYELLPGTKQFRAPAIAFFLVSFSLVAMGALTLERLAALRDAEAELRSRRAAANPNPLRQLPGIAGGLLAAVLVWALVGSGSNPAAPGGFLRFFVVLALVLGALVAWARGALATRTAMLALAALTVVDLWVIDRPFFQTVPPPEVTFAPDDVVQFLQSQPQPNRVWVLPVPPGGVYHGGGDYLMLFGIDQAGGEHPNPLQRWYDYVGAGTQSYVDWHNFLQYPRFLDAANIRYLISGVPLQAPGLREAYRGSAVVYENTSALPRAYLVPELRTVAPGGAIPAMQDPGWDPRQVAFLEGASPPALPRAPLAGGAQVVSYSPDRVVVRTRANRPAVLVLADNDYAGWRARVGGREAPTLRVNHTFRGVVVPAGETEVVWEFRPPDLRLGFLIYLVGLVLLAGYGVWLLLRGGRRRAVPRGE